MVSERKKKKKGRKGRREKRDGGGGKGKKSQINIPCAHRCKILNFFKNQINQYRKSIIHHDQGRFIPKGKVHLTFSN